MFLRKTIEGIEKNDFGLIKRTVLHMKTIFEKNYLDELVTRVEKLTSDHKAEWGKMNVHQMINHCIIWNQWVLGKDNNIAYKQSFFGKLFGKTALKKSTKNDKPLSKGVPAGSAFLVKETGGDIKITKKILIELIEEYSEFDNPDFIHDFFGTMTKKEIGIFTYKHLDHHLRQFGV